LRIFDAGGWSDTWFAGHGAVCQWSVGPGATVRAGEDTAQRQKISQVRLQVLDFDDDYSFALDAPPGRHPLLEAAVRRWAPRAVPLHVTLSCSVPPGSSLGTSASVAVALIAALQAVAGKAMAPAELARAAHAVETVDLGRQSGVQDQVAAAFGGANLIAVDPYPDFDVTRLEVPRDLAEALAARAITIYLGSHDSSAVHRQVIEGTADLEPLLVPVREAATRAAAALTAGDLAAYAEALRDSTEAQAALHPDLVGATARQVIELASRFGAPGWKVNGAGGGGGTVSIIGPEDPRELRLALAGIPGVVVLDLAPAATGAIVSDQS